MFGIRISYLTIAFKFKSLSASRSLLHCAGQKLPNLSTSSRNFSLKNHQSFMSIMNYSVFDDCIVNSKWDGETISIGTHNGTFHCDEALACGILKSLPTWKDSNVLRTRAATDIEKCHIVVDVGGVYDPSSLRFDHHQKSFDDSMTEFGCVTRLSSAGLIYRHFGLEFIKGVIKDQIPDDIIEGVIYKKVYKNFMEEVDGIDNGINSFDGSPRYVVSSTLSSRVSKLNPSWNQDCSDEIVNERFKLAMKLTLTELVSYIEGLVLNWWPARSIVESSLSKACGIASSGEIMILDAYCPWKEHLLDIELERGILGRTKFVIYSEGGSSKSWRIQTVPLTSTGFENRMPIRRDFWGLRDEELSKFAGIPGCIFVHANGFIGGNKTLEGAIQMAKSSLSAHR